MNRFWFASILLSFSLWITPSFALQPNEVLLIANSNNPASKQLAEYYQQKRKIPAKNILTVSMTTAEDCSRDEYQQQLVAPLQDYLAKDQGGEIRCIVLFYGIPLRVAAPELSTEQLGKGSKLDKGSAQQQRANQKSAVDSEISLGLNQGYPLAGWQPNPFFVGFKKQRDKLPFNKDQVMFVSRLDAPTPAIVRRIIDDSLYAEQHGLSGKGYFDARWPLSVKKDLKSYALYDASIHKAATLASNFSSLSVHLDQQEQLFQAGKAPEAAIYCGWYSLGKYVDAFTWQRGAVGYHIASSECTTLKKENSQVWCKRLLEDGVAATIGPVEEPYVQGFPVPELFFNFLLDGYYTLAESYFLSLPYLSWQMVLIGDPLYRPFRN